MRPESHDFLKRLLTTPSPSGAEAQGQRVWLDYVGTFADETSTDAYGNAIAVINPGGSPKIMFGGHADELTFLVQYIDDNGFIYFAPAGGQDPGLARGQRVSIHTAGGDIPGVIGSLAIHLQDRSKDQPAPKWHELYVDIGASSREEVTERVQVGDMMTYREDYEDLLGEVFTARGCDNRIGTFVAAEALRLVAERREGLQACVVAASTIQEENGLYGASMVGYAVHPDAALIVDVGHATDIPQVEKKQWGDVKLGGGPILSRGSVNHPVLVDRLLEVAKEKDIAWQPGIDPRRSGTDADAVFVQRGGIPAVSIGVPNRYMHSPVECISRADLVSTAELLAHFAAGRGQGESFKVQI